MFVRRFSLRDFRSWDSLTLDLTPGTTVFLGSNGHGKTNVLESLGYLSTLSSHRVSADAPMIRSGSASAFAGATVVNNGRELTIDVELIEGKSNRARINQSPTRRPREVLGILQSVMFAPEDLSLVRGDPGDRRRYLDELLTSRIPRMAAVRADYDKVLRQRSALLKTAGAALRRGSRGGESDNVLSTSRCGTGIWPLTAHNCWPGASSWSMIWRRIWRSRIVPSHPNPGRRRFDTRAVWGPRWIPNSPILQGFPVSTTLRTSRRDSTSSWRR